jgi:hypothetical protein
MADKDDTGSESLRWVLMNGKRSKRVADIDTANVFDSIKDAANSAGLEDSASLATTLNARPGAVVLEGVVENVDEEGNVFYTLMSEVGSAKAVVRQDVILEPNGGCESIEWPVDLPANANLISILQQEIIGHTQQALECMDKKPDWSKVKMSVEGKVFGPKG